MSLATKIVCSAAIPVALLLGAAGSSFVALDDARLAGRRALARVAPVVQEVAEAKDAMAALGRLHGRWLATGDPAYEQAWSERLDSLDGRLLALRPSLQTPREQRSLEEARRTVARYRDFVARQVDGRPALRRLDDAGRQRASEAGERARRTIDAVAREVDATARQAEVNAGVIARDARKGMVANAALAIALALLGSAWIGRRIARGLAHLTEASVALERGRLDQAIPVGGRDELGRLAAAFEALAASLGDRDRVCEDAIRRIGHELTDPLITIRDATRALATELAVAPGSREHGLVLLIGEAAGDLLRRLDRMGDDAARPAPASVLDARPPVMLLAPERRIAFDEERP